MQLTRDVHLEVSRKLKNSVSVKVFAFRAESGRRSPGERVCLGTLHMPETYFLRLRQVFEHGLRLIGARLTLSGSYFGGSLEASA